MSGPSSGFASFMESLKLRHFTAAELVAPEHSSEPPPELWHNGVGVLTVADEARAKLGFPLRVLSAYRSPTDNRKAGGSWRSRHQLFEALDLAPHIGRIHPNGSPIGIAPLHNLLDDWRRDGRIFPMHSYLGSEPVSIDREADLAAGNCWRWERDQLHWRRREQPPAAFRFKGGLGRYSWGVHVDTRGVNATWSGS